MAEDRGKYDDESEKVLVEQEAEIVLLAVINGKKGTGFSVSAYRPDVKEFLPNMLRNIADQIEGVS